MSRLLASALLFCLLPAVYARPINFYSMEREMALGRQLSAEVEKQARIVDDPLIAEYVNRLGQNLARSSEVAFPVTFTLIQSDELNAFTLPGGHIYVNSGLFKLSDNEAELASVLAHELAHAASRHATRQATRQQMAGIASVPLAIFGGWANLIGLAAPLEFMRYSRAFENEADTLGVQYLATAGYDPNASINMFERVEATELKRAGSMAKLLRSHPQTADRIAKTQRNIDALLTPRDEYILNTSEYEDIRERLKGLTQAQKPEAAERPTLCKTAQ